MWDIQLNKTLLAPVGPTNATLWDHCAIIKPSYLGIILMWEKAPKSVTVVTPEKMPQSSICYLPSSQVTAVMETNKRESDKLTVGWTCRPVCGENKRNSSRINLAYGTQTRLSLRATISITMRWCNLTTWHHSLHCVAHNSSHFGFIIKYLLFWLQPPPPPWSSTDLLSAGQWGITLLQRMASIY